MEIILIKMCQKELSEVLTLDLPRQIHSFVKIALHILSNSDIISLQLNEERLYTISVDIMRLKSGYINP